MDHADAIDEHCNIVTKSKTCDVRDGREFPGKQTGDNSLTDRKSYSTTQHAGDLSRFCQFEQRRDLHLPKEHKAARRSSHVVQRHCCLKCHYRVLE